MRTVPLAGAAAAAHARSNLCYDGRMPPVLFLALALLIPIVLFLLFYGLVSVSFVKLGVPRSAVAFLFISILIGGLINIPVWTVTRETTGGLFRSGNVFFLQPPQVATTIVGINVGGAVIPTLLCLYLLPRAPLFRTVIATAIVTVVAYNLAQVIPGQGIALNILVAPGVSVVVAMVLAWRRAAPVAYISGVLGVLIGADLLHLSEVLQVGGTFLSIGGAGVFDGIFLVGIIAAFLSPGGRG